MKKILGSFLIFINLFLYANENNNYFFETKIDKNRVYINEPIILNVSFFKDVNLDYTSSKFNPKIDNFEFRLLEKKLNRKDNYLITNYRYLITPQKDGVFNLNLNAVVEEVSASSLEASTVGKNQASLDEALDKNRKFLNLAPLYIEVLPNNLNFVGKIAVKSNIDATKVIANNPINFELIINFKGDIEKIQDINLSIYGVKIFTDEPKKEFYFADELKGIIKYKFALVANSNFIINKLNFKYLNPISNKIEISSTKEIKVEITPNIKIIKKLLDEPKDEISFEYLKNILVYLFFIIFGFILCKLIKIPKREKKEINNYEEIENAKTPKELLQILFKYSKNRDILKIIERVENIAYSNSKENFKNIKREILKSNSIYK